MTVGINFFLEVFCDILRQEECLRITALSVFSDALPGHKLWAHLLTAPGVLVIWVITPPSVLSGPNVA
jgi:hypothetical protein